MKKLLTITLICASLTLISEISYAQQDGFGIGAMINGPTGISYKAWVSQDHAIAGGLTFNIGDFSNIYTHADFLFHSKDEDTNVDLGSGMLRFYYGGGVYLVYNDFGPTDDTNFGLRVPIGTTYQFEDFSGDLFFEIVPNLLLDSNNTNFGFNGALGFRYYLN